jgi:uncharacterized DUF497 family protein
MAAAMFEWDDIKNIGNIAKHGIDFDAAKLIWLGPVFEVPDTRKDYGEDRFVAFGVVAGRVLAVVYAWRVSARRIISAGRASHGERSAYHQAVSGRPQE